MSKAEISRHPLDELSGVIAIVDQLAASGKGWLNLMPHIPADVPVPSTPGPLAVFSKRGPVIPVGTLIPERSEPKPAAAQLGLQHGAAAKVQARLRDTVGIPSDWRVVQDNARRGLVTEPARGTDIDVLVRWLADALNELCIPPHSGELDVMVYRG